MRRIDRSGLALPLLLLLLLALSAFGHGALLLARRELQAVWAYGHFARAKAAAEIGLRLAWSVPHDSAGARPPLVEQDLVDGQTEDGLQYRGTRRWLDTEFFLLEGIGGSRGWVGEYRSGWIGWTMVPAKRIQAFLAALEAGESVEGMGDPDPPGLKSATLPEDWPGGACESYEPLLDSLLLEWSPLAFTINEPEEERGTRPGSSIPGLGPLSGTALLSLSTEAMTLEGRSRLDAPLGCPDSGGPVLTGTAGDLRLDGGRLCGLLLVGGSLELGGSATFQGLALVGGDMILRGRAKVEGMARVRNRFFRRDEAAFRASFCPVLRALDQIPSLRHPILVGPAGPMD